MKQVFADTFYFLALLNPRDKAHTRALACTASFQGQLVTTVWVLTETDCISFVVMTREGITEALTGDHHVEQAGFIVHLK